MCILVLLAFCCLLVPPVLFTALQAADFAMEDHPSPALGLSFQKKLNYKLEY